VVEAGRLWSEHGPTDGLSHADGMVEAEHGGGAGSGARGREGARARYCTGAIALQQRTFIRWCLTGDRGPLRGPVAGRAILGVMLELPVAEVLYLVKLYGPWEVRGRPLTFAQVLEAAHPAVFEPGIVSERVPAPTDEEIALWRQAAADPDWNFPAGTPCGPRAA
jgi:hypothetical protein